MMQKPKD